MSDISEIFRKDLKQCIVCCDYNIDTRRRYKNQLNYLICNQCYLPQYKIRCRDCQKPIQIEKDFLGKFKPRCWMCHLSNIRPRPDPLQK